MYLAILSGILLAFAYPIFNLDLLAFFAFVPLFAAIRNKNLKQAFLLSYVCGLVFFAITIYWLIHVTLIGLTFLVLYLALYFGIFGIFFNLFSINHKLSTINFLVIPTIWILLEFLRSHLLTGFPWALLGYSQYLNLPIIQIADIVGVWGVSFLVMMVNVVVYFVIANPDAVGVKQSPLRRLLRSLMLARNDVITLALPFLLLVLSLGYGFYKLHQLPITESEAKRSLPEGDYRERSEAKPPRRGLPRAKQSEASPKGITVSLIQGNIPQYQKWDEAFRDAILKRYETLTKEAAKDKPDLIVWPETAAPGVIGEEPELLAWVLKLAKEVKTPLLIGAITTKSIRYPLNAIRYYNSTLLISQEGKILKQYDKLHLVPFGEYVPLEKYFPFLRKLIGIPIGDFTAGNKYTIFELENSRTRELKNSKFAVLICFEDILPGLSRRFARRGADFLVNITNDAWFKKSSAPYQHAQASVFRAVENRVPVVRVANTGLSCFIDSTGRIYDKVMVDKTDIFVVGYRTGEIKIKEI